MASAPPQSSSYSSGPGFSYTPPVSSIELTVSCRDLIDADVFSKSDPMVVLFIQEQNTQKWKEFGRTEVIQDNLNPDFVKKFIIDYFFEERQNLRFDVFDIDSPSRDLSKHDFLGRAFCSLGQIVSTTGSCFTAKLRQSATKEKGTIVLRAEEVDSCRDLAVMTFNARNLDKKDFFGKSDPFLVFLRCNEDNRFTVCAKTEVIKNTLNPNWKKQVLPIQVLCNGDRDRTIKIEVYDWNSNGSHDLIGEFSTSLNRLEMGSGPDNVYECINPKKQKKKKYKNSGIVNLIHFDLKKQYSFLEYLRGGMEMNFVVAIDFTGSNGDPRLPSSLHYIHPNNPNQYSQAIRAVGNIIQDYDTDKMFPTFGFGARLPPQGQVSHNFAVNFNPSNPNCFGIDGIMNAYLSCIRSVQLYGPTNFAPIINMVATMANESVSKSGPLEYYVLLMITDGVITDMEATKHAIVCASSTPLSIIIVGVGNDDFEAMEVLDGDDVRISSRGREAERDIVQFVPFRDFLTNGNSMMSQARLAKEVLAEVPDQVSSYMSSRNIKPGTPPPSYH